MQVSIFSIPKKTAFCMIQFMKHTCYRTHFHLFFHITYVFSYAITSQLLSTTVDKHSLPSIWGVSWLCLNVVPCIEFHLIFFWTTSSVCYSVLLAIDLLTLEA